MWFRKMGATSTLMVPTSKNSLLAKKLRLVLATNPGPRGTSTKVVEVPGPSLFSGLAVNNPFKPERCRRSNCPLLDSGEPCLGKCAKENVLYQAICHKCKPADDEGDGAISQYIGETGRTLYIRRGQHLNDFKTCAKKEGQRETEGEKSSFIWDHFNTRHKGDTEYNPEKDMKFTVLSSFRDPMTRQLMEAVKIQRAQDRGTFLAKGEEVVQVISLNRKYEHFAPQQRREKFT